MVLAAMGLRERTLARAMVSELWSERLTPILASQLGLAAADPRAQTAASMVLAAMGLRSRVPRRLRERGALLTYQEGRLPLPPLARWRP